MKRIILLTTLIILCFSVSNAQDSKGLDKSPMDMTYYPDNFAHDRKPGDQPLVRVTYSRPQKNEREIFGKLVPFGEVWRVGANEAVEIKFYKDLEFGGKKVKAGYYSLFAIPGEKEWTIILNSDLDYWGAYSYNNKMDILRVNVPVTQVDSAVENFTIKFEDKGEKQSIMKLAWDKTVVIVPIKL